MLWYVYGGLDAIKKYRTMLNLEKCTGCMACMNVCPKDAIFEGKDENGFLVPQIEVDKCVNCGLCEKICMANDIRESDCTIIKAYSLIVPDKEVLRNSSSGGAFTVLSDRVLAQGGLVVGCVMESDFTIHHIYVSTKDERNRMRGLKYVQSDIGFMFRNIKKILDNGLQVMFVGTPCQVTGLMMFLRGKDYPNLLCVDLLCHGVSNNDFFKEHIKYLERKYDKKVVDYKFRHKRYGWRVGGPMEIVKYKGANYTTSIEVQNYAHFFNTYQSLRPSCHQCRWRSPHRYSDITIADYWDSQDEYEKNDTGVSLLCVNTSKGFSFVDIIKYQCLLKEADLNQVMKRVEPFPSEIQKRRRLHYDEFWKLYHRVGYEGVVKKYIHNSFYKKFKFLVKRIVKRNKHFFRGEIH